MNIISYNQYTIDNMIDELYQQIQAYPFQCVVGIKNGGLNISIPIAKRLGLPHYIVHISFYHKIPIIKSEDILPTNIKQEKIIVIDDLIDGGRTIKTFQRLFCERAYIGVLFWNKQSDVKPDFYVQEKPPNSWLEFPWEIENE
jgi:hypoxanthine phosphoribosyltransferase